MPDETTATAVAEAAIEATTPAPAPEAVATPETPAAPAPAQAPQSAQPVIDPTRSTRAQGMHQLTDIFADIPGADPFDTPPAPAAPGAPVVALQPDTTQAPGTTTAEIPVVETPAVEAAPPAVEGQEAAPTAEQIATGEVSITVEQWDKIMADKEDAAFRLPGEEPAAPAAPEPAQAEQPPVEPVVETPQAHPRQRFNLTQERFAEALTSPESFMGLLDEAMQGFEAEIGQRLHAGVTTQVATQLDNTAVLQAICEASPELKSYPGQLGRALISARAKNPTATMQDIAQIVQTDMAHVIEVTRKVRANRETVDVRPKQPGQFVASGQTARAAAEVPPAETPATPETRTREVFDEMLDFAANTRAGGGLRNQA